MAPGTRTPDGRLVLDPPSAIDHQGSGPVEKLDRGRLLDRKYEVTEEKSLDVINAFLNSDGDDPVMLKRAKVAQAALGHVQSHWRNTLGRRALDFEMVRSITTDAARLAEYIRLTNPTPGVLKVIPAKAGE